MANFERDNPVSGIIHVLGIIAFVLLLLFGAWFSLIRKATHLDDAVQTYEEFQEIHGTCTKLNTDLCNMKALPEDDKMFEQFSKVQRVNAIKTNLNKWIEEYNSKSKMWGRSLWKGRDLPQQLTNEQFSCNN